MKKAATVIESYNTSYDSYHHSYHNRAKSSYELAISNGMIKIGELKAKAKKQLQAIVARSYGGAEPQRGEATTV